MPSHSQSSGRSRLAAHWPFSLQTPFCPESISLPACAPITPLPSFPRIFAMSFLMPSQRGFEHVSNQDLAQLSEQNQNRLQQMPTSTSSPSSPSYDEYSSQPLPPQSNCTPQLQNSPSLVFDHSATNLPKVGETRCCVFSNDRVSITSIPLTCLADWSLLSSDLHFIYMDPVLASHLAEQADSLVGKSLLAFVHPDEQASAEHDLGGVLESRTLHGSITRCLSFSRRG